MLENNPVDMSVHYTLSNRLGASAIIIDRKMLGCLVIVRESFKRKARVQSSPPGEFSSSKVVEVENKNVLSDIVSDDAKGPVAGTGSAMLGSVLQKYCSLLMSVSRNIKSSLAQRLRHRDKDRDRSN